MSVAVVDNVGSGNAAAGSGNLPPSPALSVQMSEGGIDSFAASGREEIVLDLVQRWNQRVDAVRAESYAVEERLRAAGQIPPGAPLGPPPAGTPTTKVSPFKPRSS